MSEVSGRLKSWGEDKEKKSRLDIDGRRGGVLESHTRQKSENHGRLLFLK